MLHRTKQTTSTVTTRPVRHTIKLDEATYLLLDRWKAKIRMSDPSNRLTITDIVRHGIESACRELESTYGKLDD